VIVVAHGDAEQIEALPLFDESRAVDEVRVLVCDVLGERALSVIRDTPESFLAAVNPAGRRRY